MFCAKTHSKARVRLSGGLNLLVAAGNDGLSTTAIDNSVLRLWESGHSGPRIVGATTLRYFATGFRSVKHWSRTVWRIALEFRPVC
jgi:hypothetical protein